MNAAVTLRASAGVFTKLSGTHQVLHYTKKWPHNIELEIEVSEVAQLRNLRLAQQTGLMTEVNLEHSTIPLLLASMLARMSAQHVIQIGARLAPELEAFKLVRQQLGLGGNPQYVCIVKDQECLEYWHVLHSVLENNDERGFATAKIAPRIADAVRDAVVARSTATGAEIVLFFNGLKTGGSLFKQALECLYSDTNRPQSAVLAVRVAFDEPIAVSTVLQEYYVLPVMHRVFDELVAAGWTIRYHLLEDLDRDFLLPFAGRYAFVVAVVSCRAAVMDSFPNMRPYTANSQSMAMTTFNQEAPQNLDLTLQHRLPTFEAPSEPDWLTWCNKFNS